MFKKAFTALVLFSMLFAKLDAASSKRMIAPRNSFKAKDYSSLYGMEGFSDKLLSMHFKLYEGYVKNTNQLNDNLQRLLKQNKERSQEYAGFKRMYGWEYDGMCLHEYYFENLGGKTPIDQNSSLYLKIVEQYGSFENWKEDFVATGLIRGIGWSILYFDQTTNRLTNAWIDEHDFGHLAGARPILVMDVFEHAYITEYGLDRKKYIEFFFTNIDWVEVQNRFDVK